MREPPSEMKAATSASRDAPGMAGEPAEVLRLDVPDRHPRRLREQSDAEHETRWIEAAMFMRAFVPDYPAGPSDQAFARMTIIGDVLDWCVGFLDLGRLRAAVVFSGPPEHFSRVSSL